MNENENTTHQNLGNAEKQSSGTILQLLTATLKKKIKIKNKGKTP